VIQLQATAEGRAAGTTREQWWVLGLASLASFIVILDRTRTRAQNKLCNDRLVMA
jgi:hypothetical protein